MIFRVIGAAIGVVLSSIGLLFIYLGFLIGGEKEDTFKDYYSDFI